MLQYNNLNESVIIKYLSAVDHAINKGGHSDVTNWNGDVMFTVRSNGEAYRGTQRLTFMLQLAAIKLGYGEAVQTTGEYK